LFMKIDPSRIWIFANGVLPDPGRLRALVRPEDRLFAADGGQRHMARIGLRPERVIGDLDSLTAVEVAGLEQDGVILERYPVDKDETDLELAVRRALQENCRDIRIASALGGRLDQTLGNLFMLTSQDLVGRDVRLEDGVEEVFLIREQSVVEGNSGDLVSLLPLGGVAIGVTTRGLKYPLYSETLYPEATRGISNVLLGNSAEVCLEQGLLICIHRRE
jgi:thiamine pyrophosphokinase